MALKGDRKYTDGVDISFFCNEIATRGKIMVHSTSGSGASMDDPNATVIAPTGGVSGSLPAGLLLNDVVNLDLTRQHINWHQDEVQLGGKVTLLRQGQVTTNNVSGTPSAGSTAYYNLNGELTPVAVDAGAIIVGRFLSVVDADGYAKVEINITG